MLDSRSDTSERRENKGDSVDLPVSTDPSETEITLLDALPLGILITRENSEILYSNPACQQLFATSHSELLGAQWWQGVVEEDQAAIPENWREAGDSHRPLTFEVRLKTGSDRQIWTRHSIGLLAPSRGAGRRIHIIEDISAIKDSQEAVKAAQNALSRERERARVTLECIGDAVISTNARDEVTYLNAVAEDLTGWSREKASGQAFSRVFSVVDADTGEPSPNPAEQAMDSLRIEHMPANCLLQRPDGSELAIEDSAAPILDADGQLAGAVVIFRDRKMSAQSVARMAHLARHDALTDLPNRIALAEHFEHAIELARRHQRHVGLLFIDIDRFKSINDRLGHEAGDVLLKTLSERLVSCVRSTDLVCRHGGDEFVVLLSEIEHPEDAGRVASKICTATRQPIPIQGHSIRLHLSLGISLYPADSMNMKSLIQMADTAMYYAKHDSDRDYYFYNAVTE